MPGSVLIPMSVSAKFIAEKTPVPALVTGGGGAFNVDGVLAPGVHLHWALPDALTRAEVSAEIDGGGAFFPGVPDRWLVVRFDQADERGLQRTWRAWVVDSAGQVAVDLGDLAELKPSKPALIHTATGMLASAASFGRPGWGVRDKAAGSTFDPLAIAYYPTCGTRLGFHDPLDDVERVGVLAYTVIGWYDSLLHDPLNAATNRTALLDEWKLAYAPKGQLYEDVTTPTYKPGAGEATIGWRPSIRMTESRADADAIDGTARRAMLSGSYRARADATGTMLDLFPIAGSSSLTVAGAVKTKLGPSRILCHGSVFGVAVDGAVATTPDIGFGDVRLHPTIQRAMAETARAAHVPSASVSYVEMMLQDLGDQSGTLSGVVDLPGAAHAATFQGTAGASIWYPCIDILPPVELNILAFALDPALSQPSGAKQAFGQWAPLQWRSASSPKQRQPPPDAIFKHEEATKPFVPAMADPFLAALDAALDALHQAATVPVDKRFAYVRDSRADANPTALGKLAPGAGADGAGYWLDLEDRDGAVTAVARASHGAGVGMPTVETLHEIPGPRWYRPGAPQLVLLHSGRSYLFGEDGRLDDGGVLPTRASAQTLTDMWVGDLPGVAADGLLAKQQQLASHPGLPSESWELVTEALMLDPQSSYAMAKIFVTGVGDDEREEARLAYEAAILGAWVSRDPETDPESEDATSFWGVLPSPIAITPGDDPSDPLFVDVRYAHPHSSLEQDWELEDDHVDLTAKAGPDPMRPPGTAPQTPARLFDERCPVTATMAHLFDSIFLTRKTTDVDGQQMSGAIAPQGIVPDTFRNMEVVSAALTGLDRHLRFDADADGAEQPVLRERSGALRVNELDLVDVFGVRRHWPPRPGHAPVDLPQPAEKPFAAEDFDPKDPQFQMGKGFWSDLTPRLPFWARLGFRFLKAGGDHDDDATPVTPPICGVLVPDLVEHALEVFDAQGRGIGQLTSDRLAPGDDLTVDRLLEVRFELHPWVSLDAALGEFEPLDAIKDPHLHDLVESLLAQAVHVPVDERGDVGRETGLTALLRVLDTIRSTLDPEARKDEVRVRLIGDPIVVLRARLTVDGAESDIPDDLRAADPDRIASSPQLPTVRVRVGDITRPDDGVLGCFIPGLKSGEGRFAAVSREAVELALANRLVGLSGGTEQLAAKHPFVAGDPSEFPLTINAPGEKLVILADPRGGLYATCGVLPRKKITIPIDYLDGALKNLDPTFRVGPVLTLRDGKVIKPLVPPPDVVGLVSSFVHRVAVDGAPEQFAAEAVPPVRPGAELPDGRVEIDEGWLRLRAAPPKASPG